MAAAGLAFAPASQDRNQPSQGRQAAQAVDRCGGKLIGVGLGQRDAMCRERTLGQRGGCGLDAGETGHAGHFIQGVAASRNSDREMSPTRRISSVGGGMATWPRGVMFIA